MSARTDKPIPKDRWVVVLKDGAEVIDVHLHCYVDAKIYAWRLFPHYLNPKGKPRPQWRIAYGQSELKITTNAQHAAAE